MRNRSYDLCDIPFFLIPHCCHPFSLLCSAFLLSSMFCDPLLVILRHPLTIPLPAIPLHPSLNPILLMVLLNPTIFTFAMIYVLETSNSTLYSMGVSTGSHIPFQAEGPWNSWRCYDVAKTALGSLKLEGGNLRGEACEVSTFLESYFCEVGFIHMISDVSEVTGGGGWSVRGKRGSALFV